MDLVTIVAFCTYQVFFGMLSGAYSSAMRASPEDLSQLEVQMWRENTPAAAFLTSLVLVARLVGIAFLVYLGYSSNWLNPLLLFAGALLLMVVVNTVARKFVPSILLAMIAYPIILIAGAVMWMFV